MAKQKAKQKIKVKFCPKCQQTKVIPLAGGQLGVFECVNCKFQGSVFPEKEIEIGDDNEDKKTKTGKKKKGK